MPDPILPAPVPPANPTLFESPIDQMMASVSPPSLQPPPNPVPTETPTVTSTSPVKTVVVATTLALVMFGLGLGSIVGYFRYFNDSTPPPPQAETGQLLGITEEATPSATLAPTPNLTPMPEAVKDTFPGTLAYIQDNQIVTVKADRSSPDLITDSSDPKNHLTAAPNGITLAYTTTSEPDNRPDSGINLVDRQTKAVTDLFRSKEDMLDLLSFSPSGRYLAAWANSGQAIFIIDSQDKSVTVRYATQANTGVSPITWVPGSDKASFILENELFTASVTGKELTSLVTNVVGIKVGPGNTDIPLPPVWSANGKLVAFVRQNGLSFLDLDSRQETAVVTADKDLPLDAIPFRPLAFTASGSHLIYLDAPNEQGQNVYAYSLEEKKKVALSAFGPSALYNPYTNSVIGLVTTSPNRNLLTNYSLDTWEANTCTEFPFNYPVPPTSQLFSPLGQALPGIITDPSVTTLMAADPLTCKGYELVKAPALASPLWLPN